MFQTRQSACLQQRERNVLHMQAITDNMWNIR